MRTISHGQVKYESNYCLENDVIGDSWRMFRIMSEFVDGFETMSAVENPAITIYGSARTTPDSPYYKLAEEVTSLLASNGYSIITCGGPGIMEAANKGLLKQVGFPTV